MRRKVLRTGLQGRASEKAGGNASHTGELAPVCAQMVFFLMHVHGQRWNARLVWTVSIFATYVTRGMLKTTSGIANSDSFSLHLLKEIRRIQ